MSNEVAYCAAILLPWILTSRLNEDRNVLPDNLGPQGPGFEYGHIASAETSEQKISLDLGSLFGQSSNCSIIYNLTIITYSGYDIAVNLGLHVLTF
jgi:hypothetical protein